jgi:hypothetical protein
MNSRKFLEVHCIILSGLGPRSTRDQWKFLSMDKIWNIIARCSVLTHYTQYDYKQTSKKIKINFAQVANDDNPVIEVVTRQRKGR